MMSESSAYNGKLNLKDVNNNWTQAYNLIDEEATILDIGCSKGSFGEELQVRKKCIVDGLEPNEYDAAIAKTKLNSVFNGSIEDYLRTNDKKKYDIILFLDVIEHLYKPSEILSRLQKKLKKGGSIVFSLPNMAHASVRIMLMSGEFEYGNTGLLDSTHLHYYTKNEIHKVFLEGGYKIESLKRSRLPYDNLVIEMALEKIGYIYPTEELINLLRSNEGDVFQFIGRAVPLTSQLVQKVDRPLTSPNAKENVKTANTVRNDLMRQIEQRDRILNDIYHSKAWKLISYLRKLRK